MSQTSSIEALPRALERARRRYSQPVGRWIAARLGGMAAPIARPARTGAARAAAALTGSRIGRAARSGAGAARDARLTLIGRSNAFAAESRALCRALVAPLASPAAAARAARRAPRHLEAAGGAFLARLRRTRPADGLIAALALAALAAPFASPRLGDEATIALTRHNPFAFRIGVTAEPGVSVVSSRAQTVWTGVPHAAAERAVAPEWVLTAGLDEGPLPLERALLTDPRTVEITAAPLWSPALEARQARLDADEFASLATGAIPRGKRLPLAPLGEAEENALELGAFDTGPTVASLAEAGPAGARSGIASGDYATASIGGRPDEAWPSRGEDALSPTVADALSLEDGPASLPLAAAPVPAMRPLRGGPQQSARITVVLTAIGLNEAASRRALEILPSAVAFAVAPVGPAPEKWVDAAQSRGRVALLEIPMEPQSYPRIDPGPLTLLAGAEAEDNAARLAAALAKAPNVDGVATYLGGRFSAAPDAAKPVLAALKERELFMLETNPGPLSQLRHVAAEVGLPAASSVVSLDRGGRASDLGEGFARLEEAARLRGHAIGVAVAVPDTVEALSRWLETLPRRGFRLTALAL